MLTFSYVYIMCFNHTHPITISCPTHFYDTLPFLSSPPYTFFFHVLCVYMYVCVCPV